MSSENHDAENNQILTPVDYDPGVVEIADSLAISGATYTGMNTMINEQRFGSNPKEELLMDMLAYLKELNNVDALIPFDSTKTRLNDILLKSQRVI